MQISTDKQTKSSALQVSSNPALQALSSSSVSLATVKKTNGEDAQLAVVVKLINQVVMSFNIGKNMNANQILDAAKEIISDYYFLKIEELKTCFEMGRKGKFGKVYDRVDLMILCEWLAKYDELRNDALEVMRKDKTDRENVYQIFHEEPDQKNPILDVMREVNEKISAGKHIQKIPPPELPSPEKIFQAWVQHRWNSLPKTVTKSFTFGHAYGKQMTEMEFFERKYNQRFKIFMQMQEMQDQENSDQKNNQTPSK